RCVHRRVSVVMIDEKDASDIKPLTKILEAYSDMYVFDGSGQASKLRTDLEDALGRKRLSSDVGSRRRGGSGQPASGLGLGADGQVLDSASPHRPDDAPHVFEQPSRVSVLPHEPSPVQLLSRTIQNGSRLARQRMMMRSRPPRAKRPYFF